MAMLRTYAELPECNRSEALRYSGVRGHDSRMEALLDRCIEDCRSIWKPQVVWDEVNVSTDGGTVDLGFERIPSRGLSRNLEGCDRAVVFAATVGVGIDILVRRTSAVDMAEAVVMQAYGAERVESLCRMFCGEIASEWEARGYHARPRFSPGYGDFDISFQRRFCDHLDTGANIGVYLAESMLLMPSKSVTAVMGLGRERCAPTPEGCAICDKTDCAFRRGRQ